MGGRGVLTSVGLESFATFSSMPEAHVQIHLENRLLLSFQKDSPLCPRAAVSLWWSRMPPQAHMEVSGQSFALQGKGSPLIAAEPRDLFLRQEDRSRGSLFSQRITGESGDKEIQKPKSKVIVYRRGNQLHLAVCYQIRKGCNGKRMRLQKIHLPSPTAKAAALLTGSQCMKFGSSRRVCHAREVIKTELKWFHNSNWKQE